MLKFITKDNGNLHMFCVSSISWKKQQFIICATCRGNGYIVTERLSKVHLRTKTCEDCGGSGHSGVKNVEEKEKWSME